jgi:hypothetical protein
MDMYQKRKIRKEKRENSNQNEKFHKVVLNWLITIYTRIDENLGKIRNCEI